MKISRVMLAAALCGASLYPIPSLIAPVMAQAAPAASSKAADAAVRTIPGRPQFPEKMAGKVNRRAMDSVKWRLAPAYEEPMLESEAAADTITIMGAAEASEEQMVHYIEKRNPQPKLNCSVEDIVRYYYEEAGREGIRPDVALCQALKETGFFAYGGDVSPKQNNFCGLGATGNREPGASFATPQLGVRAHIQHLMAYATQERPHGAIVDPRYKHVVVNRPDIHGHITKWTGLNGVWAVPGTRYGQEILYLWQQAQAPDGSDASLAAAEKKVRQMPDEAGSYIYRGIVYFNRAAYKEAQADFKQAAGLKPDSMAAHYNLAITQQREGDRVDEGGAPLGVEAEDAFGDGFEQQPVVTPQPAGLFEGGGGLAERLREVLLLFQVKDLQDAGHREGDHHGAAGAEDLHRHTDGSQKAFLVEPGRGGPGGLRHDQPAQHAVGREGGDGEQATAPNGGEFML